MDNKQGVNPPPKTSKPDFRPPGQGHSLWSGGLKRHCVVFVTPELIADLVKHGSDATRVVANAVPADANLVLSDYVPERHAFALVFEHDSFQEGTHVREPMFEKGITYLTPVDRKDSEHG